MSREKFMVRPGTKISAGVAILLIEYLQPSWAPRWILEWGLWFALFVLSLFLARDLIDWSLRTYRARGLARMTIHIALMFVGGAIFFVGLIGYLWTTPSDQEPVKETAVSDQPIPSPEQKPKYSSTQTIQWVGFNPPPEFNQELHIADDVTFEAVIAMDEEITLGTVVSRLNVDEPIPGKRYRRDEDWSETFEHNDGVKFKDMTLGESINNMVFNLTDCKAARYESGERSFVVTLKEIRVRKVDDQTVHDFTFTVEEE